MRMRGVRQIVAGLRDRLVASDPGLNRLRMASGGVLAMGSTLGVEYLYGAITGAGAQRALIGMLLGAVIGLLGSMGLSTGSVRDKASIALFFPVAIGGGFVLGTAVAGHRDLLLAVFVVVMFAAVFVRRFGAPFFIYGFMGWIGYFFASFLGARFSEVPGLLVNVVIGAVWVLLLSITVLAVRPDRTLQRTQRAFGARTRSAAAAAAELLESPDRARPARRLRSQQARLAEAALMIEGQLGDDEALPSGWSASALRELVIDAQLAVDGCALAALELADRRTASASLTDAGAALARAFATGDHDASEAAAEELLEVADRPDEDTQAAREARRLAASVRDYMVTSRRWFRPTDADVSTADFEPAVTLMMGNLPGSAAVADGVIPRASRWNPLSRLDLVTRQACQVALAGGLAILAGRALSEQRYYWAVIAAFIAFSGTATRSETAIKAANRVVGTIAGLGVALVLAEATAGHTVAVLVVILASIFCGFYLLRVSYAFMIFFITIMVAQLYSVLHEFTDGLLVLRLEETAIGAAIGILVGVFFLPVSTRDTTRAARENYFTALSDVLEAAASRLYDLGASDDLAGLARTLDSRRQQLSLVARPLAGPLFGSEPAVVRRRLALYATCATHARALTRALRALPPGEETATSASVCRTLAAACRELGQTTRADGSRPDIVRQLREASDVLADTNDERERSAVWYALDRLTPPLVQLSDQSQRPGAPVRASVPAAESGRPA